MKKKTVITTEKREVWIIRHEGDNAGEPDESDEINRTDADSLMPIGTEDPTPLKKNEE
jgi:hypothetical protein